MKPEQITAWALDEASAEERQQLEAALLENPQDKEKADETKAFCDFLLSELRDDSLALTDKQRERLVAQAAVGQSPGLPQASETPALRPPGKGVTRWNFGVIVRLSLAACAVLGGFWTWQAYSGKQTEVHALAAVAEKADFKVQHALKPDAKKKAGQGPETRILTATPVKPVIVAEQPEAKPLSPMPKSESDATVNALAVNRDQRAMSPGDVERLKRAQDENVYGLPQVAAAATGNAGAATMTVTGMQKPQAAATEGGKAIPATAAPLAGDVAKVQSGLMVANSSVEAGKYVTAIGTATVPAKWSNQTSTETMGATIATVVPATPAMPGAVLGADALAAPMGKSVELVVSPGSDTRYFAVDATAGGVVGKEMKEELIPALRKSDSSGESYTRIIENELKDVAREPLSTLSIDVDTASYANVRRFLNQNMIPPPDAVRIEELVNYFPTAEEGPAHEAKEPFGVRVELAPCPWQPVHRLARIAIKGREMDKNRKASNLVFLVDVSGSMGEPNKLPLVQQSLRMLTEQLGEGDRVTMVVYAGSSGVVLPPTSGEKKAEIMEAIGRLSAGGSTHGSEGIKLAYEQAVAGFIKGGVNRVILCTDGDFNVGVSSPEELEKLIKHKAKSGVFLSVLGFGSGNLKDRTMETLADKGNGNYAYIDSLSEARKVLVEQMSGTLVTIAKDVKIQVEFNPAAVRSYRLIGYENRLLAKEDFNDDTKDAGEIGAGHSVVALYEIVPANLPPGAEPRPLVDSLKYQAPAISSAQLAAAAKTGEMMTVKLRYKEPESDLSKLIEVPTKDEGKTLTASSEEYKFSAAVAGFGLLLRDSSYKGTLSWETVRRLALDGKGADKLGYRGEFLQLIDKARGLKETK